MAKDTLAMIGKIQSAVDAMLLRVVDCLIELDAPLPVIVLPSAPLRSLIGDFLAVRAKEVFQSAFEPGRFEGNTPPAFALQPSEAVTWLAEPCSRIPLRIVTWDRDGQHPLLPAMLDALEQAARRRSALFHLGPSIAGFHCGSIMAAGFSPKPAQDGRHTLFFLTPLQLRRYEDVDSTHRRRIKLTAENLTLAEILRAAAQRLAQLTEIYGSQPLHTQETHSFCNDMQRTDVIPELFNARALGRSSRQHKDIDLSGVIGKFSTTGLPAEAVALLQAVSFFSLGKSTAYGCGALALQNESVL
jgi:CRISPR-associated endoribonuclease Cas6